MKDFFSKLTGDDGKKKGDGPQFRNPFANFGGGRSQGRGGKNYRGGGQALGGSAPGRVISISLPNPGSLGMKVEKRPNGQGTAIVSEVFPNSQAESAGIQRGDILCSPGSNGAEEILYNEFLSVAASDHRPLVFDVRRIDAVKASSRLSGTRPSTADAYARKQAVIAAAEARDRANKKKSKPISKKGGDKVLSTVEKRRLEEQREELARKRAEENNDAPMTEEAKRAVAVAKAGEAAHAVELGYNPYETNKMTAGQAKTATTAAVHGSVDAGKLVEDSGVPSQIPAPAPTQAPSNPVQSDETEQWKAIDPQFDEAFVAITCTNTDNEAATKSIGTMRKLIVNATTKGQIEADEACAKFRRVRLSNTKIKAAITDIHGALELMLSVGFVLNEEDGETYLVYPFGDTAPDWLPSALERMEKYAQ
mmetsp:Transcript_4144/g.11405  ORF Transcript_4144/g.11405 Transcript_4144/m.11405 type:complete len:422 (-) Transcript_4144:1264-2529(-)|eukprot:CAMPEP_0113527432 /NCGR_PEP_ID=MMETSP0015_2-20120614/1292_1 /TAXON_ID=2838 /ORGANISM="Odontella" /LENGTH=421 /DNA_ID=CAMNT_0000425865 /DNA_START=132 /DNA_END=1397 /DNA_ORIENTATION=- /assembly_acc=CAM_ASM_000160